MSRRVKLILLCLLCVSLTGCMGEQQQNQSDTEDIINSQSQDDVNNQNEAGADWRTWRSYAYVDFNMGDEVVNTLVAIDSECCAIYYDKESPDLFAEVSFPKEIEDIGGAMESITAEDINEDGYDDLSITDISVEGNKTTYVWKWDTEDSCFIFSEEDTKFEEGVQEDISWQQDKSFSNGYIKTPDGGCSVLISIGESTVEVYYDQRQEELYGTAKLPMELSDEAKSQFDFSMKS